MHMKTRIFLTMLAVLALSFTACNKKDEPQNPVEDQPKASQFVGMWGFSLEDDGNPYFQWYLNFTQDGRAEELFVWDENGSSYAGGYSGTYVVEDSTLTFYTEKYTAFTTYNEVPRLVNINKRSLYGKYTILEIESDKITVVFNKTLCYLHRLSEMPAGYRPEYFEPDKAASPEALIGQWDQLDFFTIHEDGSFTWWAYEYPSYNGMHLLADGKFNYNYWSEWITIWCTKNVTDMPTYWGFSYRPENLSWELFQRLDLNLFCSQFDFYECDAEGNMIEGTTRTITPADPKLYTYKIFSLTDHYMVLYGTDTNMYYVFTPGHEAPTWAPKQGVNDKKMQKITEKFGHVKKLL